LPPHTLQTESKKKLVPPIILNNNGTHTHTHILAIPGNCTHNGEREEDEEAIEQHKDN